jgi:hypothetical protein
MEWLRKNIGDILKPSKETEENNQGSEQKKEKKQNGNVVDLEKKKHQASDKKLGVEPGTSELAERLEKEEVNAEGTEWIDQNKKE